MIISKKYPSQMRSRIQLNVYYFGRVEILDIDLVDRFILCRLKLLFISIQNKEVTPRGRIVENTSLSNTK